jgi:hypothetical protein
MSGQSPCAAGTNNGAEDECNPGVDTEQRNGVKSNIEREPRDAWLHACFPTCTLNVEHPTHLDTLCSPCGPELYDATQDTLWWG